MSDIEIKKGDTWVNKLDETNTVTLATVGAFSVTGSSTKDGSYMASRRDFLHYFKPSEQGRKDDSQNIAASILQDAIDAMSERGKSYDTDGKGVERSMDKVVAMFNTLTGHTLTTEQGWDFMILLKLVRTSQGYKHDNYIYGSAYFGLAGEAASEAADD